ncbi:uncharacterized protein [Cherax quadricarinatus]|nr:uncharacterized protein LOC128702160 isoform X3 [Cherax quadricarinatus]
MAGTANMPRSKMSPTTSDMKSPSAPTHSASAFSLLRYMHKMKPADLSPRNDDLSSHDSSLEVEEEGSSCNSDPGTGKARRGYCSRCDNCFPDAALHRHPQKDYDSMMVERQPSNTSASSNAKYVSNNSDHADDTDEGPCGGCDSETESDRVPKCASRSSNADGMETPHDVDLTEAIKIPEVNGKRSIVEVLSQVVKLERSSSSSASELTRTPEAPDIVTSTTKGRARKAPPPKRMTSGAQRGADVATLAILCQHYAQLVQALKEENYLLSCARSPLLATPRSSVRVAPGGIAARRHLGSSGSGRSRSTKNVFNWDSEFVQNYEQNRLAAVDKDGEATMFNNESCGKFISDIRMPDSPKSIRVQRSYSTFKDNCNNNNNNNNNCSPLESPTRVSDDRPKSVASSASDLSHKERKSWNFKPLRSAAGKHKRDSKHTRKSSFSLFRDSKDTEKLDIENGNKSPEVGSRAATFQTPTVGVLSTKINDMELKIQEILKLEPIDLIMRENSLDRSPGRRSLGSGGSLRRSASVGQRGSFYRHSVRDTRRDQCRQDVCDSDEVCDEGSRRWCGSSLAGGAAAGGNGGCQYQVLAQAAHVEVDKLRQLVHLLNSRLTELSGKMLEAEARLREEHQRSAIMERCLERRALEAAPCTDENGGWRGSRSPHPSGESTSGRRHGPSVLAWGDAATENLLRNKVEMAREEIELLRQHIDLLLRMRQEDLKVYESTVDKFRHTIASGSQW